jgi:hypothetical protein
MWFKKRQPLITQSLNERNDYRNRDIVFGVRNHLRKRSLFVDCTIVATGRFYGTWKNVGKLSIGLFRLGRHCLKQSPAENTRHYPDSTKLPPKPSQQSTPNTLSGGRSCSGRWRGLLGLRERRKARPVLRRRQSRHERKTRVEIDHPSHTGRPFCGHQQNDSFEARG